MAEVFKIIDGLRYQAMVINGNILHWGVVANVSNQNTYRTNRYTGKYSTKSKGFDPDAPFGTINESNLRDKEQMFRDALNRR